MGQKLYIWLWGKTGAVGTDILVFLRDNLGKKVDEFRVSDGCETIADMKHLMKRVIEEFSTLKDGIVVGIVPAQIYKECWGNPFSVSSGKIRLSSREELESLVICAGICALYRSLAYSIMKSDHASKVMLVHVHPVFFQENFFDDGSHQEGMAYGRLFNLWTGEDGILSRVIMMAKNQIAPFQEVHIGEKWNNGIPSILVDMGPKAIMVG